MTCDVHYCVQNYSYTAHANLNFIRIFNFFYLIMIDFNEKVINFINILRIPNDLGV